MVFFLGKDFAEGWKKRLENIFHPHNIRHTECCASFQNFSANFQKIVCTFFPQKEMKPILRFGVERFLREEMHVTVGRFSYIWKLFERQKRECTLTLGHSFILSIQSWGRKWRFFQIFVQNCPFNFSWCETRFRSISICSQSLVTSKTLTRLAI